MFVILRAAGGHAVSGELYNRPKYMFLSQASRAEALYPVHIDARHLRSGDCGGIVWDEETNFIYRHIVAASIQSGAIYMYIYNACISSACRCLGTRTPVSAAKNKEETPLTDTVHKLKLPGIRGRRRRSRVLETPTDNGERTGPDRINQDICIDGHPPLTP
jgi:hypothetical protein